MGSYVVRLLYAERRGVLFLMQQSTIAPMKNKKGAERLRFYVGCWSISGASASLCKAPEMDQHPTEAPEMDY
jgi:hypothetical protein